jgi:GrpB-like predicted nucleotidyltransferase (UPF0157 family)
MLSDRQKEYIKNLPKEIADKTVSIFPYEERGLEIAKTVIDDIYSIEPNLEVFLVGSLPLKIAGQRDIDITSNNSVSNFEIYKTKFENILGIPNKINDSSIVWHFNKGDYEISFYIVDPTKSDQLQRQVQLNNWFKSNPRLLIEYEKLKLSLNGRPYKFYLERKCEFFNEILAKK